ASEVLGRRRSVPPAPLPPGWRAARSPLCLHPVRRRTPLLHRSHLRPRRGRDDPRRARPTVHLPIGTRRRRPARAQVRAARPRPTARDRAPPPMTTTSETANSPEEYTMTIAPASPTEFGAAVCVLIAEHTNLPVD